MAYYIQESGFPYYERSHAGSAYYAPVSHRPNLHVITKAMVEKVIFDHEGIDRPIATGVQYAHDGATHIASARNEVVLCAGVFQSAQLLEVSGIGSTAILKSCNIHVLVDNPNVGENLQDHPMTGVCYEVVDGLATADMARDPQVIQKAMEAYDKHRDGPLSSTAHSIACLPMMDFLSEKGQVELTHLLDSYLKPQEGIKPVPSRASQYESIRSILENSDEGSIIIGLGGSQIQFDKGPQKDIFAFAHPGNYMLFMLALTNPFSRGTVHIKSSSVLDQPTIDPQYMSHPLDLEVLARYFMYLPTIFGTEPLASLVKPNGRVLPIGTDISTLEKAKEHCKRNLITNNHPCGTCAMMSQELGGVVDSRLRVYGVDRLRVVDASIFPLIPRGNIQSSVYAVAERAAHLMLEDWGQK